MTPTGSHRTLTTVLKRTALSAVAIATVALGLGVGQGPAAASTIAAPPAISTAATPAVWHAPRLTGMVAEANSQAKQGNIMYLSGGGHGARPAPLGSRVDCSGFVREMYGHFFGIDLGNGNADSMVRTSGRFTKVNTLQPGDVALFGVGGKAPAYHAGIFIGTIDYKPAIVAASETGSPIKTQQWYNRYWANDLIGFYHYKGATVADNGPLTQAKITGRLDFANPYVYPQPTSTPTAVQFIGWAFDPQMSYLSSQVQLLVDGQIKATVSTSVYRSDIDAHYLVAGNHGFNWLVPAPAGRHTACVVALPAGTNTAWTNIGCKTVTVPGPVRGEFDYALTGKKAFTVLGWAFDPTAPTASSTIRLTIDGKSVEEKTASPRADVNHTYHLTGVHGLNVAIPATAGRHKVCAVALPTSGKALPLALGCKGVLVSN